METMKRERERDGLAEEERDRGEKKERMKRERERGGEGLSLCREKSIRVPCNCCAEQIIGIISMCE